MTDGATIRCGDVVRHRPTGETWTVAYADHRNGDLSWCGWPPGIARIADVELVRSCTDAEHAADVERWRQSPPGDHRRSVVLRLYGTDEERA